MTTNEALETAKRVSDTTERKLTVNTPRQKLERVEIDFEVKC